MVLNRYRRLADPLLTPVASRLSGVNPDALTWLAFLCAVGAGAAFYLAGALSYHYLLLAMLLVMLNAFLDALDGWVARISKRASPRGDFLDHVLDRYADAFMIGGIVLSSYCHITVGLLGLTGVIFTSYLGTQSQALGLGRDYGGILGRADRLVILILAPLVQWGVQAYSGSARLFTLFEGASAYGVTLLELVMIWFALAGHLTAAQRGLASWRELTSRLEVGKDGTTAGSGSGPVTVEVGEESAVASPGAQDGHREEGVPEVTSGVAADGPDGEPGKPLPEGSGGDQKDPESA